MCSTQARGRTVAVALVTAAPGARRVLTDGDGHYVFDRVPKGAFSLLVTKSGYAEGAYGRLRPGGAHTQLESAEGERFGEADISLWKFAVITGTVVDEVGDPAAGATVRPFRRTLTAGRRRLQSHNSGTTDDRGVYRIYNLVPGEYAVGFESTTVAVPLEVADAFRIGLEGNDPMRQAISREMSSIRGFPSGGRVDGMSLGSVAGGLMPSVAGGRLFAYPTTFYPAASAAAQATVITLGSGDERTGVDLQLRAGPTVRVSGTVSGPEGAAGHVALRLIPAAADAMATEMETANTMTAADGSFTFLGVTPGQYTLRVTRQPPNPAASSGPTTVIDSDSGRMGVTFAGDASGTPPPLPEGDTLWTSVPVSVGPADLTGVVVALRRGVRISGRVEFEGSTAVPKANDVQRLRIFLEPVQDQRTPLAVLRGRIEPDGRFVTASVPGGRYYIRTAGAPPGWTLRSTLYEGRDLGDVPLDATTEIAGVVVTFTDRPSQLSGTVAPDGPQSGRSLDATVLVFPANADAWTEWGVSPRRLRAIRPLPNGTFTAAAIPAGDYYVIAVPDDIAVDWQDQKVLEDLSRGAAVVRIEDGQKKTLQLRVSNPVRHP